MQAAAVPVLASGNKGRRSLGRFADAYLADFDLAQLERFEALLDCTDPDLYDWIVVGCPDNFCRNWLARILWALKRLNFRSAQAVAPPEEYDHDVMCLLRAFARHQKRRN
jgi:Flavinator of succinate dehydrogenase